MLLNISREAEIETRRRLEIVELRRLELQFKERL